MRSKEGSADYRYFSDPDLPNMVLPDEFVNQVKESLPSLPHENRNKLVETGLDLSDSNVLSKSEKWILELYFEVFDNTKDSKATFNWITGELQGQMRKLEIKSLPEWFSPNFLSDVINLIDENIPESSVRRDLQKYSHGSKYYEDKFPEIFKNISSGVWEIVDSTNSNIAIENDSLHNKGEKSESFGSHDFLIIDMIIRSYRIIFL